MNSHTGRPRGHSANIFINYRRDDSAGHAGRLFDGLSSHFSGRLFMDVDTLEPGVDFVEAIEQAVGSCEVLIVIIGGEWLTLRDAAGNRRLDDPADFVRLEVEAALVRNIRVIPVLVQDASMPRAEELPPSLAHLTRRNAIELSDTRWAYDVDRLAHTIQHILEKKETSAPPPAAAPERAAPPPAPAAPAVLADKAGRSRAWKLSLAALVLVPVVVLVSVFGVPFVRGTIQAPDGSYPRVAAPAGGNGTEGPANGRTGENPASPQTGETTNVPAVNKLAGSPAVDPRVAPCPTGRRAGAPAVKDLAGPESIRGVADPPITTRVNAEPFGPVKKTESFTISSDDDPSEPSESPAADQRAATSASAETLQPPRATIMSPRNGEKVGQSIQFQGALSGLGDGQRAFLCFKSLGVIYPRGELVPNAEGQWTLQARSAKEDFETFVVVATSPDAALQLNDSGTRERGLRSLPMGASITSSVVALDRQWKIKDIKERLAPRGKRQPDSRQ